MAIAEPKPHSLWKHTNGNHYEVMFSANIHSSNPDYPPTVVYFNTHNKLKYTKPSARWYKVMTLLEKQ